jgi:cytochrome c-type biogenesis protein CcmH/NrfF
MSVPFAHVAHWTWVFYVLPVLIVIGGILRSTMEERRRKQDGAGRKTRATPANAKKRRRR